MQNSITQAIAAKFAILSPLLDERARRLWAAVEARAIGRGGISQVAEATRLSRATIRAACRNSPTRSRPLLPRLPWSGYAVRAGDANHWVRMLRTSSVP
jgi:hypothetical protein